MENLIAGIFGLLLGVAGLWTGFRLLKSRALVENWKTTNGRVIERGTYKPNQPMLSAPAFRYAPLIRYSYEVNGQEFVSNSILPRRIQMPRHSTIKWAERQAQSFPDEVVVYFNPQDPSESYLHNTARSTLYVVLAFSSFALLVGAVFLIAGIT